MNISLRPTFHTNMVNPVDHLFESIWSSMSANTVPASITPRVDVFDEEAHLVVELEMPGVRKADLAVSLEKNVLTIKAEKKPVREPKNKEFYIGERSYGTYERSFRVTDDLDAETIQANFEDGVLRIQMSRKTAAAGRKIEVQ